MSYGSIVLSTLRSALLAWDGWPRCRIRLEDFLVRMCFLFAWACRSFFFAVTLNLFWAPLWVFNFGIFSSGFRGDEQGRHGPILLTGGTVLGGQVLNIAEDPVEHLVAELRLLLLAAAEHDGDLDLVAFPEEPLDVLHLEVVVVDADLGPELDLFDLDLLLVLLGFVVLLVLLVQEVAVIRDLSYWCV